MAQDPRGEYEDSLTVDAEVGQVFDFVADARNLPKYLPTTKSAQKQGGERVRVQAGADGNSYDSDGYLRPDQVKHRLEWGADEGYYNGWMQLEDRAGRTEVTVHISLRGAPPGADERGGDAPSPAQVKEGIRKGIESIRNHVEGRGGKEEPSVAD